MTDERIGHLETLLQHPGWQLFWQYIDAEWGPKGTRYTTELEAALNEADPVVAAGQARQIVSARKQIEKLMLWPADELGRLRRAAREPELTMSRRGGL